MGKVPVVFGAMIAALVVTDVAHGQWRIVADQEVFQTH